MTGPGGTDGVDPRRDPSAAGAPGADPQRDLPAGPDPAGAAGPTGRRAGHGDGPSGAGSSGGVPGLPPWADEDTPVFVISIAAEFSGMHAQTLRSYDRIGLVSPGRASGGGRRYSVRDIALLREVQRLSQEEGVNLAGIKRIIELEREVDALRDRLAEVTDDLARARARLAAQADEGSGARPDRLPMVRSQSVVVWQPGPRRSRERPED